MTDRMRVTADLHVEVDGHTAHLIGDGSRLLVMTAEPAELYARLPRIAPIDAGRRTVVRNAAALLDHAELALDITDGRRVLVTLGHGQHSRLGRVLIGSSLVTPGRPTVVAAVAWAVLRIRLRRRHAVAHR